MTRTLNQVLEARYEEIDPTGPFARLLDVLSKGRDDSRLLEITLDIYGKIQSYPDPLAWLASPAGSPGPVGGDRCGTDPLGQPAPGGGRPNRRLLGGPNGPGL